MSPLLYKRRYPVGLPLCIGVVTVLFLVGGPLLNAMGTEGTQQSSKEVASLQELRVDLGTLPNFDAKLLGFDSVSTEDRQVRFRFLMALSKARVGILDITRHGIVIMSSTCSNARMGLEIIHVSSRFYVLGRWDSDLEQNSVKLLGYTNENRELILAGPSGADSLKSEPTVLLKNVTMDTFECGERTRIIQPPEEQAPLPPRGEVIGRCFIDITGALRPVWYETPSLPGTIWVVREGQDLVLLDSTLSVNQEIFRVRADLRIEWSPTSPYGREDRRTDQYWPFCTEDLLPSFAEDSHQVLHPNKATIERGMVILERDNGRSLPVPRGFRMRHLLESGMNLGAAGTLAMQEHLLQRSREGD